MFNHFARFSNVLLIVTAFVLICIQSVGAKTDLVASPDLAALDQSTLVATAAEAPRLVPAVLGGQPVYVLYVTQSEDTVLIRCYPGYEPTLTVRAMGRNPNANAQREGVMTCRPSA